MAAVGRRMDESAALVVDRSEAALQSPSEVVNLLWEESSVISCGCADQVSVQLLKEEGGAVSQNMSISVLPRLARATYASWALVDASFNPNVRFVVLPGGAGLLTPAGIPMELSASGLAETGGSGRCKAQMTVSLTEAGRPARTAAVEVSATVMATVVASRTAWGAIFQHGSQPSVAVSAPKRIGLVGEMQRVSFTACDVDGLPVAHSLPTSRQPLPDPRAFTAALLDEANGETAVDVVHVGDGVYEARVNPRRLGRQWLRLYLGVAGETRADATPGEGAAVITVGCAKGFIIDATDSTCTCDAGHQRETVVDATGKSFDECVPCAPGSAKEGVGDGPCVACSRGEEQPRSGQHHCDPCMTGMFQDQAGQPQCEICPPNTDSAFPFYGCHLCSTGRYKTETGPLLETGPPPQRQHNTSTLECWPCPNNADCPYGSTTLSNISLRPGLWRMGGQTLSFEKCLGHRSLGACVAADGTITKECSRAVSDTPCLGRAVWQDLNPDVGEGDPYFCRKGHGGPLCEMCVASDQYFEWRSAKCKDCPSGARIAMIYLLLVLLPALFVALIIAAHRFSPRARALLDRACREWQYLSMGEQLKATLKIGVGFVQVVAPIGHLYSIALPDFFRSFLLGLGGVLDADIFNPLWVPTACFSDGIVTYLALKAFLPLGLLVLAGGVLFALRLHQDRRRERKTPDAPVHLIAGSGEGAEPISHQMIRVRGEREPASSCCSSVRLASSEALLQLLPATLWIVLLLCPSVNATAFESFHCRRFYTGVGNKSTRQFLWASLDVECPTHGHSASERYHRFRGLAATVVVIWPISSLVGVAALLYAIHSAVLRRRPTRWSRAAAVLTREYRPQFYWWEWVDLLRRLILTGFLFLVPEHDAFIRLFLAVLASLLFLTAQMLLLPYRSRGMQLLSNISQLVVILALLGATYMYLHQRLGVAVASGEDLSMRGARNDVEDILVFESLHGIAVLVTVAVALLMVGTCFFTVRSIVAHSKDDVRLRFRATDAPPEVSIVDGVRHHVYLSHVWETAREQAAAIKRLLRRMLPDVVVFLDADDLEDSEAVEGHVDSSMVLLLFLSRGYFTSRISLREARRGQERSKPVILVHESDVSEGGLPLEALVDECPGSLHRYVFWEDGVPRQVLAWHRVAEYHLFTLKEIAKRVPALSHRSASASGERVYSHCLPREQVLALTPMYLDRRIEDVYMKADITPTDLHFRQPVATYASSNNPGCQQIADELERAFRPAELAFRQGAPARAPRVGRRRFSGRRYPAWRHRKRPEEDSWSASGEFQLRLPQPPQDELLRVEPFVADDELEDRRQVFLLYLNHDTWQGLPGRALAAEVKLALELGVHIVTMHETDPDLDGCEFVHFFGTTPSTLVDLGLYRPRAITLLPPPLRPVSIALVAQAMGAVRKRRTFSERLAV